MSDETIKKEENDFMRYFTSQFRDIREVNGNPNNELMVFDWDQTLTDDLGKVKVDVIEAASKKYALSIDSWSHKPYVLGLLHRLDLKKHFDTIRVQKYDKDIMMDEILKEYQEIYGVLPRKVIFVDDMEVARNQVKKKFGEAVICIHPDDVWQYL